MSRPRSTWTTLLMGFTAGVGSQFVPAAWEPFAFYVAIPCFAMVSTTWAYYRLDRGLQEDYGALQLTLGYGLAWALGTGWHAML